MKCKQTGKNAYPKGKAEAQLRNLKERKNYNGIVYPCVYCQQYHVGRTKKNAHKNKYA